MFEVHEGCRDCKDYDASDLGEAAREFSVLGYLAKVNFRIGLISKNKRIFST